MFLSWSVLFYIKAQALKGTVMEQKGKVISVEKDIAKGVEILLEAYQQGSTEAKNIIIETFTNNDNYKHQKSISFVEKIKNYLSKLFS